MQQAMKHGKTLEPVWHDQDLDTFDTVHIIPEGLRNVAEVASFAGLSLRRLGAAMLGLQLGRGESGYVPHMLNFHPR